MSLANHQKDGNHDFPDYLLSKNQLTSEENVSLVEAAAAGNLADVIKWLGRGAKPDFFFRPKDQMNALHLAAEKGHTKIVKALLAGGAEVNCLAVTEKATALTLAAQHGDAELLEVLLAAGAIVNHGNAYGNTALHEACRCGHMQAIDVLLRAGAAVAGPDSQNNKGSTPTHLYCLGSSKSHPTQGLQRLLDGGAEVGVRDKRGATALLSCCASGRLDLMKLLVDGGADPHTKDDQGQDACAVAAFYGQEQMIKALQK
ncbi:ankyrin repeat-containing domain protein [Ochromonadaceae sp. CCMP2298]|nr:ankyrin repeat-containing domain protein [Ochromonadaceae sp. CCMP2298]|eukprot:CAMPEP_0173169662 /NCGR_PEP_ID=MMETSP1141-20130122/829_1 /TAXON_ID=483371 /ORGANISM="non described non described, Strain CCMP2298" /LENGTH=257 /DNA_ID=CAMNT_0014091515 /DNA_START=63 /DNA_END=836 /DNA_ORIENTATION=-